MTLDDKARAWEWRQVMLLCAAVLLFVLPTLGWHDFRDGMENLVVVTAAEVRRDQTWLVPTLDGEARLKKPPLAHWITAGGLATTALGLSDETAARWPSLLMATAALPGVYLLGRMTMSWRAGVAAAVVAGTSYFFFKFTHRAGYDPQLLCWTTWCNLTLVWSMLRRRWMTGLPLAGALLGLAVLTKGPVALVVTVLPVAIWWLAFGRRESEDGREDVVGANGSATGGVAAAVVLGLAVFAAVGLGWFVLVIVRQSDSVGFLGTLTFWYRQVTLRNEIEQDHLTRLKSINNAGALIWMTGMWAPWVAASAYRLCPEGRWAGWRETNKGAGLAVLLVVVPAAVMIAAAPLRERYLVPLLPGEALLAGWMLAAACPAGKRERPEKVLLGIHWTAAIGMGAAVAAFGGILVWNGKGVAWLAVVDGVIAAGVVAASAAWERRRPWLMIWGPVAGMLVAQAGYFWCDSFSEGARSAAKGAVPAMLAKFPRARFVTVGPVNTMPREFMFYLGKTVPRVDRPGDVPGGDVVYIVRRKRGTATPEFAIPQGDVRVGEFMFDHDAWDFWHR